MSDQADALMWTRATMHLEPRVSGAVPTLRIPAFIDDYTAVMLEVSLPEAVSLITRPGDDSPIVEVRANLIHDLAGGGRDVDPGEIVITASELTERIDAGELREELDRLVSKTAIEGEQRAERDKERCGVYLAALAGESRQ